MAARNRTLDWLSAHPLAQLISLAGSAVFAYGVLVALIHHVLKLGLGYTLLIAVPLAVLVGLSVLAWIASRPRAPEPPVPLPPISLVLEPGALAIGQTGALTCRVHVTNNAERPVKFLFARLGSTGTLGAADIYDGDAGRAERSYSVVTQMTRIGEIEKDSTDLVACTFSQNVANIVAALNEGATHDDTVDLVDQDGNAHPVVVQFRKVP